MPPRHAYWTIFVDHQPTAFRAHDVEELMPTFNRLKEKSASVELKWFERGKLFDSRDAAREAGLGKGERRWEGPRPERDEAEPRGRGARGDAPRERSPKERDERPRDRNWRPGGEHRDPRQKYKDAKKAKWQRFKQGVRDRHEKRMARGADPESFSPPHGDPLRDRIREERSPRASSSRPKGPAAGWSEDGEWPPSKPHGDKRRAPRDDWRDRKDRGARDDWRSAQGGYRGREERGPAGGGYRGRDDRGSDRGGFKGRDERRGRPPRRDEERGYRESRGGWQNREDSRGGWKPQGPPRDRRADRESGERGPAGWRDRPRDDDRRGYGSKPDGTRKPGGFGGKKPFGAKPQGAGRGGPKKFGAKKPWSAKPGARGPGGSRPPKKRRDED